MTQTANARAPAPLDTHRAPAARHVQTSRGRVHTCPKWTGHQLPKMAHTSRGNLEGSGEEPALVAARSEGDEDEGFEGVGDRIVVALAQQNHIALRRLGQHLVKARLPRIRVLQGRSVALGSTQTHLVRARTRLPSPQCCRGRCKSVPSPPRAAMAVSPHEPVHALGR